MNAQPGAMTLSSYLLTLRRLTPLTIVLVLLSGGTALALSLVQKPVYVGRSSVAFQDESRDLAITGASGGARDPGQLAAASAQTITRPAVLKQVKESLHTSRTLDDLAAHISATVDPTSNLVAITATAGTADAAAHLANVVARQSAAVANGAARRRYELAAQTLHTRFGKRDGKGSDPAETAIADQEARLQSLSVLATPATVSDIAQAPSSPASPRTALNVLLGVLAGLVLAAAAALVRARSDRRLGDSAEVHAFLGLPLLGSVRKQALGRVVGAEPHRSADEAADAEAFRIVRSNLDLMQVDVPARIVLVTSAQPEEGKTTVASSLAFAMAAAGRRTALVECDLRRPTLAARIAVASTPGLSDVLLGDSEFVAAMQTIRAADPETNGRTRVGAELHFLPAGSPLPNPAETLGSPRFGELLDLLTASYDHVVLDTSPLLPVADTLEILSHADAVVFCVRALQTTRDQAWAGRAALMRGPERPVGVVVTGTRNQSERYGYGYAGAYETTASPFLVTHRRRRLRRHRP